MQRSVILRVILPILLITCAAFGQGVQYGTIAGTVSDSDGGGALPGVTVTATGPSLQGSRVVITNENGRFVITPLPAGSGYQVAFDLSGFGPQALKGVTVSVGTTTEANVQLKAARFKEQLVVTANQTLVDTTKSTVDTSVSWKMADTLPTNRDFISLMNLAPMVDNGSASGYSPLIAGQSNSANLYLVDGVDTTDPKVGIFGTAINWDTIAEAQLQTAAFTAEYGRATGGILNLVTKSGSNNFELTGRLVRSDPDWSAKNGIDSETGKPKTGGAKPDEWRPSFTVGGPLLLDKLWYYGSFERRDEKTNVSRYATLGDRISGALSESKYTNSGHYGSAKLTWQANPKHNFVLSYNTDPTEQFPLQAGIYGAIYNEATERRQEMGGDNYAVRWTGIFGQQLFAEGNYQNHSQHLNTFPTSPTFNSVPYTYDLYYDYAFGGPSIDYRSQRDRDGLLLNGSYFLDTQKSTHNFKAGVERSKITNTLWNIWNSAGQYWDYLGGPYRRFLYLDQSGGIPTDQDYSAIYVQDQWRAGRLTVNAGIRAEATTIKNNRGASIVNFGFGKEVAPRLGFAYDLNGDTIRGSVGRFYQLATNYIGDAMKETTDHTQRWDWNYKCALTGDPSYKYPDSCWTLIYDIPRYAGGTTVDPNLKPAYMDEVTLGYDKQITARMAANASFVWRWMNDQIDWYDPTASGRILITNVPKTKDVGNLKWSEYQALSLSLAHRFAENRLQFLANYTYTIKNDAWGTTWRDLGFYTFSNPELVNSNRYGRITSPHLVKLNGSYVMPWKTVVGLSTFWSSGSLYTATKAGTYGQVFIEDRGSSRVGNNWEANLYLEHPFKIGSPLTASVYANVFNLFNNQQTIARQSNSGLASFRMPVAWQNPRVIQLGMKFVY